MYPSLRYCMIHRIKRGRTISDIKRRSRGIEGTFSPVLNRCRLQNLSEKNKNQHESCRPLTEIKPAVSLSLINPFLFEFLESLNHSNRLHQKYNLSRGSIITINKAAWHWQNLIPQYIITQVNHIKTMTIICVVFESVNIWSKLRLYIRISERENCHQEWRHDGQSGTRQRHKP